MTEEKKLDNRIWRKDDSFKLIDMPEIHMDAENCKIPQKCVPLHWGFDWTTDSLLGHVDNIRVEDGEIFGDVDWRDEKYKEQIEALWREGDVRLGGYYSDVFYTDDKKNEIATCTLRAVSFVMEPPFGANPGANINEE